MYLLQWYDCITSYRCKASGRYVEEEGDRSRVFSHNRGPQQKSASGETGGRRRGGGGGR